MHAGVLVAAGVALLGAIVAAVWLPARASYDALAEEHAPANATGAPAPADVAADVDDAAIVTST
jgi:hypothetical protein